MAWWEITLAALGYAVVMRAVAGHVAYAQDFHSQQGVPDLMDWVDGWGVGLMWPLAVAWVIAGVVLSPGHWPIPAIGAERRYRREAELREREQRIRDAERELGIGQ